MALRLPQPIHLAAIDAGSNAFRLIIARVRSTDDWEIIESVRAPVRLGHAAFTTGNFDRKILRDATEAFRQFRRLMDRHGVIAYRAVATSAAREARNSQVLVERIRHQAKINLEIISGDEEARLVRVATLRALRNFEPPRFILDLGGGSLELNEFRPGCRRRGGGAHDRLLHRRAARLASPSMHAFDVLGDPVRRRILEKNVGLPLGTVHLMETFQAKGVIP